ncbi:MAG: DnaD domain protein [Anaerolineales bacterium]|jgi:DNA replication protein
MIKFSGFPEGKVPLTPVPDDFFRKLLPQIDHLGELKLSVYVFWRLDRMQGMFRYLQRNDLLADEIFMQGMGKNSEQAEQNLDEALERAVRRGTLLRASLDGNIYYFLNSPKGRAGYQALQQGEWDPASEAERGRYMLEEKPNIFKLYEENIGPLTPMIAETLRDTEASFPAAWIEQALQIAVENNVRNWHYVNAILDRWQREGRHEQKDRRDSQKARSRYAEWESPGEDG